VTPEAPHATNVGVVIVHCRPATPDPLAAKNLKR